MSGIRLSEIVKQRLEIHYRLTIVLTDEETLELDELLGFKEECDNAIAKAETMPVEELNELVKIIIEKRKRKKKTDEIPAGCG
ncbi:MAG: hypothetical protein ACREBB_06630 [Nitrosotalea sp.]